MFPNRFVIQRLLVSKQPVKLHLFIKIIYYPALGSWISSPDDNDYILMISFPLKKLLSDKSHKSFDYI